MPQSALARWQNTIKSAMDPDKARIMLGKVLRRLTDSRGSVDDEANVKWLAKNARYLESWLKHLDAALYKEIKDFIRSLDAHAASVLKDIPYDLGGGGAVPLLYALTRLRKPERIVETGVASGYSSATFLAAIDKNGTGHLYSSDFPYFRIPEPEKYIGVVVDPALKSRWSLYIKGDEVNLSSIVHDAKGEIDLFHYDSDKSYNGRRFALETVLPVMGKDSLIIMDDIQDNGFFHDYITKNNPESWSIFSYSGKYIGVIGDIG